VPARLRNRNQPTPSSTRDALALDLAKATPLECREPSLNWMERAIAIIWHASDVIESDGVAWAASVHGPGMPTGAWCLSSNQPHPHPQRDHTTLGSVIICFCQEQLHAKSVRIQEGALAWAGGLRGQQQQQQQQRATATTVPHRRTDTSTPTPSRLHHRHHNHRRRPSLAPHASWSPRVPAPLSLSSSSHHSHRHHRGSGS